MTDIIVKIIEFITGFLIKIMPDFSDFTQTFKNASGYVQTAVDFIKQVNFVVPLSSIMLIVVIEVTVHLGMLLFWVGNKIVKSILEVIP